MTNLTFGCGEVLLPDSGSAVLAPLPTRLPHPSRFHRNPHNSLSRQCKQPPSWPPTGFQTAVKGDLPPLTETVTCFIHPVHLLC